MVRGDVMSAAEIEERLEELFKEQARAYIRRRIGGRIQHFNGVIKFYARSEPKIILQDDEIPNLPIRKADIQFVDDSRKEGK